MHNASLWKKNKVSIINGWMLEVLFIILVLHLPSCKMEIIVWIHLINVVRRKIL